MITIHFIVNWKSIAAVGGCIGIGILASKVSSNDAKDALDKLSSSIAGLVALQRGE